MGGINKGLQPWRGQPLVWHVARRLAPQVGTLTLNANRDIEAHTALGWPCQPDDPELPPHQGPIVGLLTGLRHARTPWLQLAPCDSPQLPADLVERLRRAALEAGADIAVPVTPDGDARGPRHHWTTALVKTDLAAALHAALQTGERRMRGWMTQTHWIGVSFADPVAFLNINTLETLHGPV